MKTDKWFYEFFLSQPGMLSELIPGIESGWEFIYSAPVIKEKEFRLDGVFIPVSDDPRIPIVFAEAQMQSDPRFYGRYFSQLFQYLYQYQVERDWQGLLILPSRARNFGAELPYTDLLAQRITRIYLSDLKNQQGLSPNLALLQLLVTNQQSSAEIGKAILKTANTEAEFERCLSLIETILVNRFPNLTQEMIMQILDLKQMDITKSRFYQEVIQEGRLQGLEQGLQRGLEQGLQRGLEQGLQRGEAQLVIRLLDRRFGLSASDRERILGLPISQLENLSEALLDFNDIADLAAWFSQQQVGSPSELI